MWAYNKNILSIISIIYLIYTNYYSALLDRVVMGVSIGVRCLQAAHMHGLKTSNPWRKGASFASQHLSTFITRLVEVAQLNFMQ